MLNKLMVSLEALFKKHFPLSYVATRNTSHGLSLTFRLVGDINKLPSRIPENDPARSTWFIELKDGKVFTHLVHGGTYSIKSKNPHMAMDSIKLGWRNKTTVTPEQMLEYFCKYVIKAKKKMQELVNDSYGNSDQVNIYKEHLTDPNSIKLLEKLLDHQGLEKNSEL